jgi:hypothetical protein
MIGSRRQGCSDTARDVWRKRLRTSSFLAQVAACASWGPERPAASERSGADQISLSVKLDNSGVSPGRHEDGALLGRPRCDFAGTDAGGQGRLLLADRRGVHPPQGRRPGSGDQVWWVDFRQIQTRGSYHWRVDAKILSGCPALLPHMTAYPKGCSRGRVGSRPAASCWTSARGWLSWRSTQAALGAGAG